MGIERLQAGPAPHEAAEAAMSLIRQMYPICRSITGDGVRRERTVVVADVPPEPLARGEAHRDGPLAVQVALERGPAKPRERRETDEEADREDEVAPAGEDARRHASFSPVSPDANASDENPSQAHSVRLPDSHGPPRER